MGIAPSTNSLLNRQHPSNCLTRIESVWSDHFRWCNNSHGDWAQDVMAFVTAVPEVEGYIIVFPSKATTCCTCLKLRTIHAKSHILEATPRPICLFLPLSRRRICSQAKRESSGKRPIQPMGSYGAQGHWCEFGVPKFLGKTELLGIWSGAIGDSANLQNSTTKWLWVMSYDGVSYQRGQEWPQKLS